MYRIFIPAYEALEGFFDKYGRPIIETPQQEVETLDGETVEIGAKEFLKNERDALRNDAREMNEIVRQFPFTTDEAFRDSVEGSLFNIGKIYEQIDHNENLYPDPVVRGNFTWKGGIRDTEVVFVPSSEGRWFVSWMPPDGPQNQKVTERGKLVAPNKLMGLWWC